MTYAPTHVFHVQAIVVCVSCVCACDHAPNYIRISTACVYVCGVCQSGGATGSHVACAA